MERCHAGFDEGSPSRLIYGEVSETRVPLSEQMVDLGGHDCVLAQGGRVWQPRVVQQLRGYFGGPGRFERSSIVGSQRVEGDDARAGDTGEQLVEGALPVFSLVAEAHESILCDQPTDFLEEELKLRRDTPIREEEEDDVTSSAPQGPGSWRPHISELACSFKDATTGVVADPHILTVV